MSTGRYDDNRGLQQQRGRPAQPEENHREKEAVDYFLENSDGEDDAEDDAGEELQQTTDNATDARSLDRLHNCNACWTRPHVCGSPVRSTVNGAYVDNNNNNTKGATMNKYYCHNNNNEDDDRSAPPDEEIIIAWRRRQ
jgi:hypothetical protein